ncbi:nucleoside hydrolase [Rhodococcus sp. D2-41]|uniref:nucleoside hydrolase n=1 Tax=Speluncibacter jeojiensis TaxID=2710754 RepID=UPI002410683D|nr:nucleoside hydrolase [Rhodococcus sp. D2-41]MDG3011175.1 nucleoside hydrolase [Rhodococcus sp. D2-41]
MTTGPRGLILDVDTGVDDAVALVYLLACQDRGVGLPISGIACTAGNVSTSQVVANTLAWLDLCRAPAIEVALGAPGPLAQPLRTAEDTHGPHGTGYAELPPSGRVVSGRTAAQLWVATARSSPGRLTGLVTGPLTNLALAIRLEPDLPRLLDRLVVMGGAFDHPGNTTACAEWNIAVDPEAAAEVFAAFSGLPAGRRPLICPLDVTETIAMTPAHLDRLAPPTAGTDGTDGERAGTALLRRLREAIEFYVDFHRDHGYGMLAQMHDPFAAACALDRSLARTRPATVDVELRGTLTRGQTVADRVGLWGRPVNADIVCGADPEAFLEHLIDRIGGFASRL